jgi:hypothetical protein
MHNYQLHPWAIRRYVSLVYPLIIFYSTYCIVYLKNKSQTILSILITSIVVTSMCLISCKLLPFAYTGNSQVLEQIDKINKEFSNNDIIIYHVDNYEYSTAIPLKLMFNKNVILLPRNIEYSFGKEYRVKISNTESLVLNNKIISYIELLKKFKKLGWNPVLVNPSNEFIQATINAIRFEKRYESNLSFLKTNYTYWEVPNPLFSQYNQQLKFYNVNFHF